MKLSDVEEVEETRSVERANKLLGCGWHLLEINVTTRGPIYILGARSISTISASNLLPG